jgi:hypothetical protein
MAARNVRRPKEFFMRAHDGLEGCYNNYGGDLYDEDGGVELQRAHERRTAVRHETNSYDPNKSRTIIFAASLDA